MVERNLGFEAEHHQRALNGLPHTRFRIDRNANRYGILTTEEIKYGMMTLFNNMLRDQRVSFYDPLCTVFVEVNNSSSPFVSNCRSWKASETRSSG